jgi:predicted RNA methylase
MLSLADVRAGHTVLEPSAGCGNIGDALLPLVGAGLDVIEINYSLQEILKLKGHNLVGSDFLECQRRYDRICMNPPFERGQDIDHVRHAYRLLNPGGRLVSVMSEGTFFRRDRKATDFRTWLYGRDMDGINIDAGAFKESGTNVAARVILINNKSR